MRHLLSACALTVTTVSITACCTGGWEFDEPARKAIPEFAPEANIDAELDYPCSGPDTVVTLLDKAVIILEAEERFLVERQRRYQQALTEGEKERLARVRDRVLERILSDLNSLQDIVEHLVDPAPTARLGLVYEVGADVAPIDTRSSATVAFDHAAVLRPPTEPTGVVARDVSPTQALAAMLDGMKRFAREIGALDPEARAALGSW